MPRFWKEEPLSAKVEFPSAKAQRFEPHLVDSLHVHVLPTQDLKIGLILEKTL